MNYKKLFSIFLSTASLYGITDDDILKELQQKKAIPTFEAAVRPSLDEGNCKLNKTVALRFKDNGFQVITSSSTQQANTPFFDTETLSLLYAYSIGLDPVNGQKIADGWPLWSQIVPQSFIRSIQAHLYRNYSFFKAYSTQGLTYHNFDRHIDTTLVNRYAACVKAIVQKPLIIDDEKFFVTEIVKSLVEGNVLRNGSSLSRWIGHAKESIIKLLHAHPVGKEILMQVAATDPQLQSEIEAYTTELDIFCEQ